MTDPSPVTAPIVPDQGPRPEVGSLDVPLGRPTIVAQDHKVLRAVSLPIKKGTPVDLLLDAMHRAMCYPRGIGLAAPQIGVSARAIVVEVPHGEHSIRHEIINPEIYWSDEKTSLAWEGCLSFPQGFRAMLARSTHIKVRGFDRQWRPLDFGARDMVARVIQHERDHLDGILITDKAVRTDNREDKRR